MKFKKKLSLFIRQYQTRQHLHHLPEHLYDDIKRSTQEINIEVNKNTILTISLTTLRRLFKGVQNGYIITASYCTVCIRNVGYTGPK